MISTRGRYALALMIDIAEQNTNDYIALKDIAKRQGISKKYLEIIIKKLVDAKLLEGRSGKNGGYRLTKKISEYNIYEILKLTETSLSTVSCVGEKATYCERKNTCKTCSTWAELNSIIKKYLQKKKLSEFV